MYINLFSFFFNLNISSFWSKFSNDLTLNFKVYWLIFFFFSLCALRKVPLAAESHTPLSPSSTSSVTPQLTSSPTSVFLPSDSSPHTATFPQSTSTTGLFSIRDAAHTPISGKARNGAHKTGRSPKGKEEDTEVGTKKRKNSSHISASLSSHSSLYLTVDNHKKNGNSYHPTIPVSGGAAASPAMRKTLGREGLWHSGDDWPSRSEGSQSFNSQSRWELTVLYPWLNDRSVFRCFLLSVWKQHLCHVLTWEAWWNVTTIHFKWWLGKYGSHQNYWVYSSLYRTFRDIDLFNTLC